MSLKQTVVGTSAANTAQTVSVTGIAKKRVYLFGYKVFIKAAAAGADITIDIKKYDGTTATTIWSDIIGNAAGRGTVVSYKFGDTKNDALPIPQGFTLQCVVAAGGAACVTVASLEYMVE